MGAEERHQSSKKPNDGRGDSNKSDLGVWIIFCRSLAK